MLEQLGDLEGSMISAAAAQTVFSQLGEQRGWLLCKESAKKVS